MCVGRIPLKSSLLTRGLIPEKGRENYFRTANTPSTNSSLGIEHFQVKPIQKTVFQSVSKRKKISAD